MAFRFSILLLLSALLLSCGKDTQVNPDFGSYYYTSNKKHIVYKYKERVFWKIGPIATFSKKLDADAETFEVITSVWGRDKEYIYNQWMKVINVDAATFVVDSMGILRDKDYVYVDAVRKANGFVELIVLEGADPETIYKDNDLWKDKNHVFVREFGGVKLIESADPETYEYMSGRKYWARDKNHYYYRNKLVDVDLETLRLYSDKFWYDNKTVFMIVNDMINKSQKHTGNIYEINKNILLDDKHIYYSNYTKDSFILPIKNPQSFSLMDSTRNIPVFMVDSIIYWHKNAICNVDIKSFKMLNSWYAKDKNHIYIAGKGVDYIDVETFMIIEGSIAKDKKFVYIRGKQRLGIDAASFGYDQNTREYYDKNGKWKFVGGELIR